MNLKDDRNQKDSQSKVNIRFVIHIVCIVGFLCCAAWLIWYLVSVYNNKKLLDELAENYVTEVTPAPTAPTAPTASTDTLPTDAPSPTPEPNLFGDREYPDFEGLDVPQLELDFASLQEENPDIYAWIYVPDTKINYPVVQRAGEADYYLKRDLKGNNSAAGTLYTQYYNHKDWLDNLTVIYGHNMRDGSMFAALHYFEDSKFFEEHPYIYIYTPEYTLVYEVFASHEFPDVHLLLSYTMNDSATFARYLDEVLSMDGIRDNINRDVDITAEDRVLALSTCMGSNLNEYRYIVEARLAAVEKTSEAWEAAENGELSGTADAGSE